VKLTDFQTAVANRKHAQALGREDTVAAIERMWVGIEK